MINHNLISINCEDNLLVHEGLKNTNFSVHDSRIYKISALLSCNIAVSFAPGTIGSIVFVMLVNRQ